jgi:hypothetical protein
MAAFIVLILGLFLTTAKFAYFGMADGSVDQVAL